jgi:ATP-dependent protease ClpP protease subunit
MDALDEYNEVEIHEIYNSLMESGNNDILELRINSHGGYLKSGHTLCNIIQDKFPDTCITIIDSIALSMAAVLFLQGSTRVVYPHSTLMLHDYSAGYYGKISDVKTEMEFDIKNHRKSFKRWLRPHLTKKEWKRFLDGKDLWFDAVTMCKKGMATHIIIGNNTINAEKYIKEIK